MRSVRILSGLGTAAGLTVLLAACGGGSGGPTNPTPNPGGGSGGSGGTTNTTVTITSAGVSPKELRVPQGTRVTFVNNDNRTHEMYSDPHPDHSGPGSCQELNQVGFLQPGANRQTGNLNTARTCSYHDHNLDTVESLKGSIVVTAN